MDGYLEDMTKTHKRAMELEEKEKLLNDKKNMKYFINAGLFGGTNAVLDFS